MSSGEIENKPSFIELLLQAIRNHDLPELQQLVAASSTCTYSSADHQQSLLTVAIEVSNAHGARLLLSNGLCDPHRQDQTDGTWKRQPLHFAAARGNYAVTKLLIEYGADVNSHDQELRTPLHWAATQGDCTIATLLIENGAAVNMAQLDGFTPLHVSTCLGHSEICGVLLCNGAEVNRADRDGWTPLHEAACYGHSKIVDMLLRYGASINKLTNECEQAFQVAASAGHLNVLKILQHHSCNISHRNINGYSAFHLAVCHNRYEIAKFLAQINVNVNCTNHAGKTPLFFACVRGDRKFIELLVNAGADLKNEKWLHQGSLPTALQDDVSLASWLKQLSRTPQSLVDCCASYIRKLLNGDQFISNLDSLPVPTRITDYIGLRRLQ